MHSAPKMEAHGGTKSTAQNQRYYDYDYDNFAKKTLTKVSKLELVVEKILKQNSKNLI